MKKDGHPYHIHRKGGPAVEWNNGKNGGVEREDYIEKAVQY